MDRAGIEKGSVRFSSDTVWMSPRWSCASWRQRKYSAFGKYYSRPLKEKETIIGTILDFIYTLAYGYGLPVKKRNDDNQDTDLPLHWRVLEAQYEGHSLEAGEKCQFYAI